MCGIFLWIFIFGIVIVLVSNQASSVGMYVQTLFLNGFFELCLRLPRPDFRCYPARVTRLNGMYF